MGCHDPGLLRQAGTDAERETEAGTETGTEITATGTVGVMHARGSAVLLAGSPVMQIEKQKGAGVTAETGTETPNCPEYAVGAGIGTPTGATKAMTGPGNQRGTGTERTEGTEIETGTGKATGTGRERGMDGQTEMGMPVHLTRVQPMETQGTTADQFPPQMPRQALQMGMLSQ